MTFVKVIDNIVSDSCANDIFQMTLNEEYRKISKTTNLIEKNINTDYIHDEGQETCILAENNIILKQSEILNHLIQKSKEYIPEISEIERIKINRLEKIPKKYKQFYNTPHTDFPDAVESYYSMIYYCNDSDGYTYLFNEFYNPIKGPDKLTIYKKIKPKKGRALIFESGRWHSSSNPILTECRVVINFVFKTTKINYNKNISIDIETLMKNFGTYIPKHA